MGQGWRATDTQLNRDVAPKILPSMFLRSFQRCTGPQPLTYRLPMARCGGGAEPCRRHRRLCVRRPALRAAEGDARVQPQYPSGLEPAARHRCRLVLVSTSGTVGCSRDPESRPDEEAPWCESTVARWPYYRSKLEAERPARALAEALGVELVVLRPPALLGPGDHRFRSTSSVLRALRRRLPFVVRGGMHFADIRDAARALASSGPR